MRSLALIRNLSCFFDDDLTAHSLSLPLPYSSSCALFPSPIEWDVESSNSSLTFSNKYDTLLLLLLFATATLFYADRCTASNLSPSYLPCNTISHMISLSHRSNTTAERAGSVSCYPAAFADLPADRSIITIVVDACPRYVRTICFESLCRTKRREIYDLFLAFPLAINRSLGALTG